MRQDAVLGLKGAFLVISIWSVHFPNADAQPPETVTEHRNAAGNTQLNSTTDTTVTLEPVRDSNGSIVASDTTVANIKSSNNSVDRKTEIESNTTSTELTLKVDNPASKREIENTTANEVKSFLHFPTLPFLFPKEGDSNNFMINEFTSDKIEEREEKEKGEPLLLIKFAFNIHQIPLTNETDNSTDLKVINEKKIGFDEVPLEPLEKKELEAGRSRRNIKSKKGINGFFDDFSLFPHTDIDEFFPKPDLFFPDLLLHRKPLRKLSRRKRAMKKPDMQSDIKFIMDMFDEAFMRKKRDLEKSNPILDFLRGSDLAIRNVDDVVSDISPVKSNDGRSVGKWKNRRNVRKFVQDGAKDLNIGENPLTLIDKVVEVGQIQLTGNIPDKLRTIKKKRDTSDSKKKSTDKTEGNLAIVEKTVGNNEKHLQIQKIKELYNGRGQEMQFNFKNANPRSAETTVSPQTSNGTKNDEKSDLRKVPNKVATLIRRVVNSTENILNYAGDLIRVVDSLEAKFKDKMDKSNGDIAGKHLLYGDLEKNITRVLAQFLSLFNKMDNAKFDMSQESFDWTENETLQSTNVLGKRSKKNADFIEDYVGREKRDRQVADLNYLFLTVTLPTIIISALLLFVCFFNLQVKGKICTKLFKPRRVYVIQDESPPLYTGQKVEKPKEEF